MISYLYRGFSFPVCVTTNISVGTSIFKISSESEWWREVSIGSTSFPFYQMCLITFEFKVVAKSRTMVIWEKNPKNVTDSVCSMETKFPTLSNDFPPETAHLFDSWVPCGVRAISSLQTIQKDKSFKVWNHHGNTSDSLPCPHLRMIGTGLAIPLKLAKASRLTASPSWCTECIFAAPRAKFPGMWV